MRKNRSKDILFKQRTKFKSAGEPTNIKTLDIFVGKYMTEYIIAALYHSILYKFHFNITFMHQTKCFSEPITLYNTCDNHTRDYGRLILFEP